MNKAEHIESEGKLVNNTLNPEAIEAKEECEKEETKKEVEDQEITAPQPPRTGDDRIQETILMMTKFKQEPVYKENNESKFAQLLKTSEYQPWFKINTDKTNNGQSRFWVKVGKSGKIITSLKANSASFESLMNYIVRGNLIKEIDFDCSDFDNLDIDWEIHYLQILCTQDCDPHVYYGEKGYVYITYKGKFGDFTFKVKEEGIVKDILVHILNK